jgi:hypothetical protein
VFKSSFKENLVAAVAALVLTSTAVGAAVGPARAVETAPAASLVA